MCVGILIRSISGVNVNQFFSISYPVTQQNAFHTTPKNNPIQAPATARTKEPVSIYNNHSLNAFIFTPNTNFLKIKYRR